MAIHGGATCRLAALCLLLLDLLALQGAGAAEPLVPAMFVFGDSLVDVGNNNFIEKCSQDCKANYPHYGVDYLDSAPTGRFSNGYNLADHLAKLLGFAESPPPFLSLTNASSRMSTGINFASGGSGLLPQTGNNEKECTQVLSTAEQVGNFTNLARSWASGDNRSADLLSKSLFFVSAGSNDLFEYIDLGLQANDTEKLQSLVASYAAYLRDLYGVGARKFSVVGTSALGCSPSQRLIALNLTVKDPNATDKYGCFAVLNNLSAQLHPMLDAMLQDLSRELPGMNYSLANSLKMAQFVLDNPSTPFYNFTVLDEACCGDGKFRASGCNFAASLCSDRSTHLFWDDYHPTEVLVQLGAAIIFADDPARRLVQPFNVKQLVGGGAATLENI